MIHFSVVKHEQLKAGQFLIECLFIVECSAPAELQIGRFLPHTPVRVLINQIQKDLTDEFEHEDLLDIGKHFDKQQIIGFLNSQRQPISKLIEVAEVRAKADMQVLVDEATQNMLAALSAEIKRLARLQKVNPTIKTEEIEQDK